MKRIDEPQFLNATTAGPMEYKLICRDCQSIRDFSNKDAMDKHIELHQGERCLRGEHEADVFISNTVDMNAENVHRVNSCKHCRCLYVAK